MAINLGELINKLNAERYLGIVVFGDALCGKTTYVKKFIGLNTNLNLVYLDAQELFEKHPNTEKLLAYPPKEFMEWIQQIIKNNIDKKVDAVFLDNMEALYNIWSPQKQNEFIDRRAQRIEKSAFNIPIITLIQSDDKIQKLYNEQSPESFKRIISFNELIYL